MIKEFKQDVYEQAVQKGYDHTIATQVAARAVLNRLSKEEGLVVAETADFTPTEYTNLTFTINEFTVDEAEGGGTIVVASLLNSLMPNELNQRWTQRALERVNEQINAGGVHAYAPDEHGEFRKTGERNADTAITEWVRSKVVQGSLIIEAKLKKGWEWVADMYKQVSIEARVPKSGTSKKGSELLIDEASVVGFVFTQKSKNPLNRVLQVVKEIWNK